MRRCCSRVLRPLSAAVAAGPGGPCLSSNSRGFLCASPVAWQVRHPLPFPLGGSVPFKHLPVLHLGQPEVRSVFPPSVSFFQKRDYAAKKKSRVPATPVTSKVKKYKIKGYSSFKSRFRVMNDGNIMRWRAGKRHNAHLKSKKSKRRLRKPALVPLAYAKVMKKLHFCA